jgi:DNA-directed RNA polymerase specialized sigma subunit
LVSILSPTVSESRFQKSSFSWAFIRLFAGTLLLGPAEIYQKYQAKLDYQIEDYFNEGNLDFEAILADFKPLFSTRFDNFATQRIKYRLIDRIRQISQAFGHNTWSLLLNSTGARLSQALQARGLVGETLENYLLAWDYYKEIYAQAKIKTDGKIQEPSFQKSGKKSPLLITRIATLPSKSILGQLTDG